MLKQGLPLAMQKRPANGAILHTQLELPGLVPGPIHGAAPPRTIHTRGVPLRGRRYERIGALTARRPVHPVSPAG
jgi:hypothetical protein